MPTAQITALGTYTPPNLLTNADLERMVETSNEWILERTGIHTRHIAPPEMATSDMAAEAANALLASRGIPATDVEAIIVCTVTPDMFFPSTACLVQNRIGAKGAWGFDLIAACSGFVFGLTTADNAGDTPEHRALNYCVVRYPAIYARTAQSFGMNASLSGISVEPARLGGPRNIQSVVLSYTHRATDVVDKFFLRVDVTEKFPFLVTKLSPYYDRT